jgi:hypothetical protein
MTFFVTSTPIGKGTDLGGLQLDEPQSADSASAKAPNRSRRWVGRLRRPDEMAINAASSDKFLEGRTPHIQVRPI